MTRICFIMETREPLRPNPVIAQTVEMLESCGAKVSFSYPEAELWQLDDLRIEADLYLLKSDSEMALSLAQCIEISGGYVVNSFAACSAAKDKIVAAGVLTSAGIATPESFALAVPGTAPISNGPMIFKPNRGYHGVGISIVRDGVMPCDLPDYQGLTFAQRYLAGSRNDLKIYGIGDKVFGVRKAFSPDSFTKGGEPAEVPMHVIDVARACAGVFGLSLYGLDIAEIDGESVVVDVNYFPGYRGVPDGAKHLSEHILGLCRRKN